MYDVRCTMYACPKVVKFKNRRENTCVDGGIPQKMERRLVYVT